MEIAEFYSIVFLGLGEWTVKNIHIVYLFWSVYIQLFVFFDLVWNWTTVELELIHLFVTFEGILKLHNSLFKVGW